MDRDSYNSNGRVMPSAATSAMPTPLRSGTPNTDRSPFGDTIETASSHHPGGGASTNPFASPDASRPASSFGSISANARLEDRVGQRFFHSRKVAKGDIEKPWLEKKDPKEKWVTILPILGITIGLAVSGFLIYDGITSVVHHSYCPVMDEQFSGGLNPNIWTKEVEVGGFGNGQFDMTTGGDENVYIENGHLFIKATLQDEDKIEKNNVMDLLDDGSCTSDLFVNCVAATNVTAGNSSIVPPARSGRINTRKGASIKYGRVEVTAKLPEGDWLWPAIWMMPVKDTYGEWPLSGEIDIMESRGNNHTYEQGGNNVMSSALHWGPDFANDAWWRTNNKFKALHTTYASGFNTYGLEWSEKYIFTYVNTRLLQVLYTNFNKPMWERGNFPETTGNGTRIEDVWSQTGRDNTPFDHSFYLILNVGVGGTNGWFEDGKSGKPWVDDSPNAPKDFWGAREKWFPTWKAPQLEVSRIVMQQQCDGGEL